jgi:uncharacterized membrane protein YsdA (DUF1294 family)
VRPWIWALLLVNLAAFLVYAWDKLAARRRARRVPEAHLLWVSTPLAAVGAWLAVLLLRHKSAKPGYLVKLALVTAVQALAAGLALGRYG